MKLLYGITAQRGPCRRTRWHAARQPAQLVRRPKADRMYSSGLRRGEGGTLLLYELPALGHRNYYAGRVGQAMAKPAEVTRLDAGADPGLDSSPTATREQQRRTHFTDLIRWRRP